MDLKNFLIQECEYVSLSTNGQRLNLSVDKSTLSVNNNDCIPEVNFNLECPNEDKSLNSDLCNRTAGSTVLASNTCYNCDNFSEEFENMKIAVEILQSKTDALQSLANV